MNIVGPVLGHYDTLKSLLRKGFKGDYLFTGNLFSFDPANEREDELILHWLFQYRKSKKIKTLLGLKEMIIVDQYLSLDSSYSPLLKPLHKENFLFDAFGQLKDARQEEQLKWLSSMPIYLEYKKVIISPSSNIDLNTPIYFKDLTPADLKLITSGKTCKIQKRRVIGTLSNHNRSGELKELPFFSLDSENPSSGEILVLQYPTYILSSYK